MADRKVNIDITMEEVSNGIKNLKRIKAQRQDTPEERCHSNLQG